MKPQKMTFWIMKLTFSVIQRTGSKLVKYIEKLIIIPANVVEFILIILLISIIFMSIIGMEIRLITESGILSVYV